MVHLTVFIRNATRQRIAGVVIRKAIFKTIRLLKMKGTVEISVMLVGEQRMRSLNGAWRGKHTVTDVLSFGFLEHEGGVRVVVPPDGVQRMGEIIICLSHAKKQARTTGISFKKRVAILASHGAVHLYGIDHERSESEHQKTTALEKQVAKHF